MRNIFGYLLIAAIILLVLWARSANISLMIRRNRMQRAWGQLDAQFLRRANLVPELLAQVHGYAGDERDAFEQLALLRKTGLAQADIVRHIKAERAAGDALARVLKPADAKSGAVVSADLRDLREELSEIEDKLATAASAYDQAVHDYNAAIAQFPASIVAQFGSFKSAPYFGGAER